MTALLLGVSSIAGVVMAPSSADGAAAPQPEPVTVWVHKTHFQGPDPADPSRVHALPNQEIIFRLVDPTDRKHTVTVVPIHCRVPRDAYEVLCDKSFDKEFLDPANPTITYQWSDTGERVFYDKFAWEENPRREMTGTFDIAKAPTTTTTAPTTTSTTAPPTTTTRPATTTTVPTPIRPLEVPPEPTTTTTAAANVPAPPPTAPPVGKDDKKDKNKDKPKDKGASTETSTTTPPSTNGAVPPDSIFDAAMLTPGMTEMPVTPATNMSDELAIDASGLASLLDAPKTDDESSYLLLLALAGIGALLLFVGGWAWFTRSSRYDPA
jgi:hypothetical protein